MKGPRSICDNPECRTALMTWAVARSERVVQARRDRLAGVRTCKECGDTFPLTSEHFPQTNENSFRALCRSCWRARNRTLQRKYNRRKKMDPERIAARAETARLAYGLRVERKTGQPPKKHSRRALNGFKSAVGRTSDALPVEPFGVWVDELIRREIPDFGAATGGSERDNRSRSEEDLAAELGVSPRALYRLRVREYKTVSLGTADAMLTRYGKPIVIDGERAAARLAERCREMPGNGERILRYIDLAEGIAHLDGAVIDRVEDLYEELA